MNFVIIMANTYTQLAVHIVFAVKYRQALIALDWDNVLYAYMNGTLQNKGHKPLIINGVPDHVHILIELNPQSSISDTVRELKKASTAYVNAHNLTTTPFQWQTGFAAFAVSKYNVRRVINYIKNQKQHHLSLPFMVEYRNLLKQAEIDHNDKYLFEQPRDK